MIKLLHQPVPPLNLPAVPVLDDICLPDQSLLLHLPACLGHTDLPACPLADLDLLLDGLAESLVGHHLILKVGACTHKFMRVLVLYDDGYSLLVN